MKEKLRLSHTLKVCLILILLFSTFPEVVFSHEDTYDDKVEIGSATSEGTNSCDEHHCPIIPTKPFHHCAVCCVFSHYYIENLSAGAVFHLNKSQTSSLIKIAFYKELFDKSIFHPPQSII